MRIISVILTVIISMFLIMSNLAFAHYPHIDNECPTTEQTGLKEECIIQHRQSGKDVKFVDIYFTEGVDVGGNHADPDEVPNKIEVEPGDGIAILIAVMANSGPFELTGMRGWLSLPIGFNAAGRATAEPSFDTYDLGIKPGATFMFEFPVEVTKNTRLGLYDAILHVEYFEARNIGMNFRDFNVEFQLTGKSVLDVIVTNPILLSSTKNNAVIEITNDGSAPASGVIATISIPSGTTTENSSQIVNFGKNIFNIGVIKPYDKAVIVPILYVNPVLADTRQNLNVEIAYFDSYGERKNTAILTNFLVAGSTTESIDFKVTTDKPVIRTITETPFIVTLNNTGKETARSVEITVNTPLTATVALNQEVPEASRSPISIIGSDGYSRISEILPNESADVQLVLFASEEAVNTAFQLPVTISYIDSEGGVKRIQRQISVYVQGTIGLRVHDLGITHIGNEHNVSGFLLNEGTNMALFTTVELLDNQNIIKQVSGPQYLGDLTANSPLPFNIPVRFAEGTGTGTYPVTIKTSYKDDLRIPFKIEIDGMVSYTPIIINDNASPSMYSNIGILVGIGTAGGIGYYFIRRRKIKASLRAKRDKSKIDSDYDDLDFLSENKQ